VLTADLVRARRKGGALVISQFRGDQREQAASLAESYLGFFEHGEGERRADLQEALDAIPTSPSLRKVALGLVKLLFDRAEFEGAGELDPVTLRREVFEEASRARQRGEFDRARILAEVGERHALSLEDAERALFGDLKEEQRLVRFDAISKDALVAAYELSQVQAVLLRAESIEVDVRCGSPAAARRLFRTLKFHRLLHRIERKGLDYRVVIDGPASLFQSSTRYGLRLALVVPALRDCDAFDLRADVRWGPSRERLVFEWSEQRKGAAEASAPPLPDEIEELYRAMRDRDGRFEVEIADEIFDVPGLGTLVPDLRFRERKTGRVVYFEALGHWSRDAVWKRVDLVGEGLPHPILFAVPSRLRVSAEVLPDELPASLLIYKGKLSAKKVEAALGALAGEG
jgi:uncharacterized protein